jgi:PAS domain-containing protein/DNA-binding CsgD family transcriptional regulator
MSEDDELSGVVGRIYDAAQSPALWADALADIAAFVGGRPGALSAKDLVSKFVNAGHHVGPDLLYMQMHSETYGEFDPLAFVPLVNVGHFVGLPGPRDREKPRDKSHDERCKARVRADWARPQGDIDGALIETSEKDRRLLNVAQSVANGIIDGDVIDDDMIDDDMGRRMALVAPHARRAVLIGKAIDRKADEAATFADILDTLSAGLFLIDVDGRIVHANAAGREILGADDFLGTIDGHLVARDTVHGTFQDVFASGTGLHIGSKGIAMPLMAQDGECHVAHVLPLGAAAGRRPGGGPRSGPRTVAAAVFVFKATLETPSSPEVIRRAYQLTPAELRVLLAIVNVGGIPEVATALGVADSTIKTHVRRLFDKTGTGRQADLVKLVAGFFSPLVA